VPETLPYLGTPGMISIILAKIQPAQTPERFDGKFLQDTLGLKGGWYRSFIPFAKRMGLLTPDGAPTELYKQFRTEGHSSTAIAKAIRIGYQPLFVRNENAHELPPKELRALIIQVTGKEEKAVSLDRLLLSFGKLKEWANFEGDLRESPNAEAAASEEEIEEPSEPTGRLRISYTINLNLPETSDPKVFNAIFRALKEHLLREEK
jgi:hypothetical protein